MEFSELMDKLREYVGERTDDETIDFIDTIETYGRENNVKEVEERWRKKYINRFYGGVDVEKMKEKEQEKTIKTYEDLFESKED